MSHHDWTRQSQVLASLFGIVFGFLTGASVGSWLLPRMLEGDMARFGYPTAGAVLGAIVGLLVGIIVLHASRKRGDRGG